MNDADNYDFESELVSDLLRLIAADSKAMAHYRILFARKLMRQGVKRADAQNVLRRRFCISRRRAYEVLAMALNHE